jgi:OOP family OmpA-OmpF porin
VGCVEDQYWFDKVDDLDAKWRLNGGITYGIGGRWGLQYTYHGMASDGIHQSDQGRQPYVKYKGNSQELNLLYSLKKDSRVALFVGANRVHNELNYTCPLLPSGGVSFEGSRTHLQGGVVAKAPLSNKVDAYGLVGGGTHGLFKAEAGLAFKMKKNWEANVGYRWFRVKDAFNETSCPPPMHGIDPIGTVRAEGVTFGLTHFFGATKKKQAPPEVEPPVVNPPENKIEQELIDKKKIVLKGVNFDFDKDTLQPQGYPILNQVVDVANKNPQWDFLLVGHTCSIGTDAYNLDLSWRRVKTVRRYLISQGIDPNRLAIDGKGERQPIDTNETREGRAQNRRVELSLE